MLSKKNRLTTKEYKTVFNNGKTIHSPLLLVKLLKSPEEKKFSAVVPKKVLKKAFERNILRRFIYNILQEDINTFKDVSAIFIMKRGFNNDKKEVLKNEILEIIKKNIRI